MPRAFVVGASVALLGVLLSLRQAPRGVSVGEPVPGPAEQAARPAAAQQQQLKVQVPPPPFSEGVFPCTDCHNEKDLPTNRTRRQLVDAHDDIVLKHDEEHRWCLDCHDSDNRDRLHLAGGQPVPFERLFTVLLKIAVPLVLADSWHHEAVLPESGQRLPEIRHAVPGAAATH